MKASKLLAEATRALSSSAAAAKATVLVRTPEDASQRSTLVPITGIAPDDGDATLNFLFNQPEDDDPPLALVGLVRMLTGMPAAFLDFHVFASEFRQISETEGVDIDSPVDEFVWDEDGNAFVLVIQ